MDLLTSIISLNRGTTRYGPAPHKPVMLLAVIEAFERGILHSDKIAVNPSLISLFEGIWDELVHTGHSSNFALPFFHLKNEKGEFWELVPKPGEEIPTTKSNSIKSFGALLRTVDHARISPELYRQLSDPASRRVLKEALLTTYFQGHSLKKYKDPYEDIRRNVAADPDPDWIKRDEEYLESITDPEKRTYEYYMRSAYFSEKVCEIYRYTCAISHLHCEGPVSLVDACHIIPFRESFNNSLRNGIALTPTLHRAFDNGLIAIGDDYRVLVKPDLEENTASPYHLGQFRGTSIADATEPGFLPLQKYLGWHRERWGF